jgi:PleD family two-component response regulator
MTVEEREKPSVLLACSDEWMSRSFESVLTKNGYLSVRIGSGVEALKVARRAKHDVIVLDEGLDDLGALEVCRALRDDPLFDHSTPILITTPHVSPQRRAAAYAAGAWEYCSQPLDFEILFLKLETFLRARQELARAQSRRLIDPSSGLYTAFGLQQLATQLAARALREHEPFACVALEPHPNDRNASSRSNTLQASGLADVASMFLAQSRKSDIVGYVSQSRLAILAPDTDAKGARLLVARLQRELDEASKKTTLSGNFSLHAGYCAVSDFATANVALPELVHRAESALDRVESGNNVGVVLSFDELPPS